MASNEETDKQIEIWKVKRVRLLQAAAADGDGWQLICVSQPGGP
jgi:hypothetical protein